MASESLLRLLTLCKEWRIDFTELGENANTLNAVFKENRCEFFEKEDTVYDGSDSNAAGSQVHKKASRDFVTRYTDHDNESQTTFSLPDCDFASQKPKP